MANPWIEAMRLRTIPVSTAGVLAAWAVAIAYRCFSLPVGVICLVFAIGAQIASNFANEYFDFRNGLDRKGREGFRRGVTEGDIKPQAMLRATLLTLGLTCLVGLSLVYWGGWWLVAVGVVIALFALAYSAGPYPLSHHGLGEVTVIIFFGLVPVLLTVYVMGMATDSFGASLNLCAGSGQWSLWPEAAAVGLGAGMMAANVLIVNNVRDEEDDRAVGKHTLAVKFGGRTLKWLYLFFFVAAVALFAWFCFTVLGPLAGWLALLPGLFWFKPFSQLMSRHGAALNPVLGLTARTMLLNVAWLLVAALFL